VALFLPASREILLMEVSRLSVGSICTILCLYCDCCRRSGWSHPDGVLEAGVHPWYIYSAFL